MLVILKDYNLEFLKHIIMRSGREGVGNRRSRGTSASGGAVGAQ